MVALDHQLVEVLSVGAWGVEESLPDQVEQLGVAARELGDVGGTWRRWQLGQKNPDQELEGLFSGPAALEEPGAEGRDDAVQNLVKQRLRPVNGTLQCRSVRG